MVKESKAALVLCKEDEKSRIVKRLKILYSVLKKFHGTLIAVDEPPKNDKVLTIGDVTVPSSQLSSKRKATKTESMEVLADETVTTEIFFESMGITASPTKNVLYESKREKSLAHRGSPKIVDSTFKVKIGDKDTSSMPLTPSRRVNKSAFVF